jgi:phospholipid/cholesterol/gamma-HCH transport system substrate-binding protein
LKLAIRFADKIVGVSIVLAIAIMVFVLFMLGTNQRWFARDHVFFAYFDSAVGLSANMPVQYRGFSIGQVRSVSLADDDSVEVRFVIFDDYIERARAGSIVELAVSPVAGLGGNQFVFRPGTGEQLLEDGATVPAAGSAEAKMLAQMGLAGEAGKEDGIASIVDRIATLAVVLTEAIQGSDSSSLGRTMLGLESASSSLQQAVDGISASFTYAPGTMYSGNFFSRYSRSSPASASPT